MNQHLRQAASHQQNTVVNVTPADDLMEQQGMQSEEAISEYYDHVPADLSLISPSMESPQLRAATDHPVGEIA